MYHDPPDPVHAKCLRNKTASDTFCIWKVLLNAPEKNKERAKYIENPISERNSILREASDIGFS